MESRGLVPSYPSLSLPRHVIEFVHRRGRWWKLREVCMGIDENGLGVAGWNFPSRRGLVLNEQICSSQVWLWPAGAGRSQLGLTLASSIPRSYARG